VRGNKKRAPSRPDGARFRFLARPMKYTPESPGGGIFHGKIFGGTPRRFA
jgi:hypothetical protein